MNRGSWKSTCDFKTGEAMKLMSGKYEISRSRDRSGDYLRKCVNEAGWLLYSDLCLKPITIVDISIDGLGIVAKEPMNIGDPCAIGFKINIDNNQRRINVWAIVVYCVERSPIEFKVGVHICEHDFHSKTYIEALCESGNL